MIKKMTAALALAAASSASLADVSFSINQNELTNGAAFNDLEKNGMGVMIESVSNDFKRKTVNGVSAVGVLGGNVSGEIDSSESILFTFDQGVTISDLQISFLYNAGEFGDDPAEQALISTNLGDFVLGVTGPTTADWSGAGAVANLSVATEAGAGHWSIFGDDIFGGAITSLRLSSNNPGANASFGDFSFVSLSASPVPAPGAIGALAISCLGLARRRR